MKRYRPNHRTLQRAVLIGCGVLAVGIASSPTQAQQCMPERYELLMPAGLNSGDQYGFQMARAGDWLFVGAPLDDQAFTDAGAVYAFEFVKGVPAFRQKIVANGVGATRFGCSIACDGQRLLVGAAPSSANTLITAAYIFEHDGTQWTQTQELLPFGPGSVRQFGFAVAIQDDLVVVGARVIQNDGVNGKGGAFIFQYNGTTWAPVQRVTSDVPTLSDEFGTAVAIGQQTILVGSRMDDTVGGNAGAVFVFSHDGTEWVQQQKFHGTGTDANDNFGTRVVVDGLRLMVGAPSADFVASAAGAIHPYRFESGQWIADGGPIVANNGSLGDQFATSLALHNDMLLVGAPHRIAPGMPSAYSAGGAAYVFREVSGVWVQDRHFYLSQPTNSYGSGLLECWANGPPPSGWPLTLNNANLGASVAIGPNQLLASTPSLVRPQCWSATPLPNTGSVNVFETVGVITDCNGNLIQDECDPEPDCNGNYRPDSCDIAANADSDCDLNSIPDECQMGFQYQLENEGTNFAHWAFTTTSGNADFIWINQYRVQSGEQVVTHISLPTSQFLPIGAPVTVLLYSDPNQDGNPSDAVLLTSAETTALSHDPDLGYRFVHVPITPTKVGDVGDFFFIGAVVRPPFLTGSGSWYITAAQFGPSDLRRSWYAGAPPGQSDVQNLSNNATPIQLWTSQGPFVLRAIAADCNNNGVWDACDIANDARLDLNTNGIIDACEQSNCVFADVAPVGGDNQVGVPDLLTVISNWGVCTPCFAICPGDVNDDCAVGVPDLLAVIGAWGPCP